MSLSPALLVPFEQVVWASESTVAMSESSVSLLHASAVSSTSFSKHSLAVASHVLAGSRSTSQTNTWQAWRLPHRLSVSPLTHLPILSDGQTALPSNAHNFHGEWNASVDPRTGNASFTLAVASTLYDQGQAKRDLTLTYSGGPSAQGPDTFGLGPHWSFNIGTERPSTSEVAGHQTTDITTGDGHGFTMESVRNNKGQTVWRPLRHKLGDVTIIGQPGNWTIAMDTGLREHLHNGYEDWEATRDGQRVWFYYDTQGSGDTTRHLEYVCAHTLTPVQIQGNTNACQHDGVWITWQGNTVTIHGQQQIELHRGEDGGIATINAITLPPLSSAGVSNSGQPADIDFSYDDPGNRPWLLRTVTYPTGGSTTFLYNSESDRANDQPNGLPTGLNGAYLPVVAEQIVNQPHALHAQLPQMRIWYRYGSGGANQHNYTGYQSGVIMEPGKDNLMDRPDSYTYSVTQDNGTTSTTTTYNKYHLPLSVVQMSDLQHAPIARSDQHYLPWKQTTFAQLPPNYSLPIGTYKTLYAIDEQGQDPAIPPAHVVQAKRYNDNGQVIWQRDAYGRQTLTEYCPPQGDSRCPAMDPSWPQVTLPEKILKIPAQHSPAGSTPYLSTTTNNDPAPAVEVEFNYIRLPEARHYLQAIHTPAHSSDRQVSPTPGFWEVSSKIVGTLPLNAVSDLKPGDILPDLANSQISTRTQYHYNTQQTSPTYGQLTQLTVTQFPTPPPAVNGALLKISANPVSATPQQKVTIDVIHRIDSTALTSTTTMKIAPSSSAPQDIKPVGASDMVEQNGARHAMDGRGGLSLGTSVYSLVSGVKLASEDTLKTIQSAWTYDIWNRPIKEVVTPVHGGKPQTTRWAYIMTPQEMAVVKTLPNGSQQKVDLSADNKVVTTWHRFANQANSSMEGASNWIEDTTTTYTQTGKVASHTVYHAADPKGRKPGRTIALTTFYGYDALNRQTWVRQPDGQVQMTVRNDPAMQVIRYRVAAATDYRKNTGHQKEQLGPTLTVIQGNVLGKPVARYVLPLGPAATKAGKPLYSSVLQAQLTALRAQLQPVTSLQHFNSYGLLPVEGSNGVLAFVNAAIAAGAWYTRVTMQYDGNGHRIRQTLGNGATTQWQWQQGNLVATIMPDGQMIHDTLNVQGQKVTRCVQPAGSNVCHTLGTRGYDSEGNLAWQADEMGNLIHYTYDSDGRRLSMTLPAAKARGKGHVFTYQYNSLGPTSAALNGVVYVKYTYNPTTWQLTDQEDAISHLHYQYAPNSGQLTRIIRSAPIHFKSLSGIHYPTGTTTIHYDRYNQPIAYTDSEGDTYTTVHDNLDRVIQLQVQLPGQTQPTLLTVTTYDAFGRPHTITNGADITRTFNYNRLGQVQTTRDSHKGHLFQQLSYTYDPNTSNILTFTRQEGNNSATQTYTYDLSDNLTTMTCSATDKPGKTSSLCPRDTDLTGSSLTTPPIITVQHYTFDPWNNIKSVRETLVTSKGKTTTKTVHYRYAGNQSITGAYDPNQMTGFTTTWANQRYNAIPKTLIYDRLGRIIKDAAGDSLHYNAFGQQDGFTSAKTGEYTRYTYDSSGHQIAEQPFASPKQQHPLQAPLYMLYSGNSITAQAQEDAQHHLHVSVELGSVAHSEDGVITRWYLHDYKGDVLNTFNTQGTLLSDNVYSPYGMQYNRLSTAIQTLPAMLQLKNQPPWWQSHQPGFDNQMQDPATGYQFLGGGYRAYNPVYRHFMAKDSFSPFKKIDGYGFGANNPIMNVDPTGHLPEAAGIALGAVGIVASFFLGFLLPIAGAVLATAGSTIATTVGTGFGTALSLGISGSLGAVGVASGSLQIAGATHPKDQKLVAVNTWFGIAGGIAAIALGGITFVQGMQNAVALGVRAVCISMDKTDFIHADTMFWWNFSSVFNAPAAGAGYVDMLSGLTGAAATGIGIAVESNHNLAKSSGIQKALEVLGYLSMAFMAVSTAAGIGAITGGINVEARVGAEATKAKAMGLPLPYRLLRFGKFTQDGKEYLSFRESDIAVSTQATIHAAIDFASAHDNPARDIVPIQNDASDINVNNARGTIASTLQPSDIEGKIHASMFIPENDTLLIVPTDPSDVNSGFNNDLIERIKCWFMCRGTHPGLNQSSHVEFISSLHFFASE